jgi:hypothetical protein
LNASGNPQNNFQINTKPRTRGAKRFGRQDYGLLGGVQLPSALLFEFWLAGGEWNLFGNWIVGFSGSNQSCFRKRKIRIMLRGGASDDEMVDEAELEETGCFGEAASDVAVGPAGTRIAGRMVVDEDESVGLVEDDGLEDVAGMGHRLVDGAVGKGDEASSTQAGIEESEAEGFVGQMAELGGEGFVNRGGGIEGLQRGTFARHARTELESSGELGGFGEAEPVFFRELGNLEPPQRGEPSVFAQEPFAYIDGALALDADSQKNGEKLGIAECSRSILRHAFTRT